MKKIFLISTFIFISLYLNASIFDFIFLDKAQTSYEDENYDEVLKIYDKLNLNSSKIIYNRANSLYKLKKYQEAKKLYESIQDKKLLFQKWHNIGNSSAKLNQIDYAIKAYELALEIKDSENTKFNLELLKKEKAKNQDNNKTEENDKKSDNPKDKKDSKKNNENNQTKKNQEQNSSKSNENNQTQKNQEQNSSKSNENNQTQKNQEQNSSKSNENNQTQKNQEQNSSKLNENNQTKDNNKTQGFEKPKIIHISEKEMRKYQQMLDKRGINTLMLPFNRKSNGENNNELKPW